MHNLDNPHFQTWEALKESLAIGTPLQGVVTKHAHFGVFVALPGIPFKGLIELKDFQVSPEIISHSHYPAIGASVNVVVLGFKDVGHQIWLSTTLTVTHQPKDSP